MVAFAKNNQVMEIEVNRMIYLLNYVDDNRCLFMEYSPFSN